MSFINFLIQPTNLVEPPLDLVAEMIGPDSGECAETTGGLDVANNTNNNQRGSLDNRNRLCTPTPSDTL